MGLPRLLDEALVDRLDKVGLLFVLLLLLERLREVSFALRELSLQLRYL